MPGATVRKSVAKASWRPGLCAPWSEAFSAALASFPRCNKCRHVYCVVVCRNTVAPGGWGGSRGGYVVTYTECPRRNVPDFGSVFLMLNYTDITQNTYVQSWTVTEIMAREKCGLLAGPLTVPVSWRSYPYPSLSVVSYYGNSAHSRSKLLKYFLLGDKVLRVSAWHSCHV